MARGYLVIQSVPDAGCRDDNACPHWSDRRSSPRTPYPAEMQNQQLKAQVDSIEWYHSISLPGGVVTPGVNNSPVALERLQLPASLSGKTVLDIGAWDGFYSFEAARRGASRVLATDSFVWNGRWGQTGFNLARAQTFHCSPGDGDEAERERPLLDDE